MSTTEPLPASGRTARLGRLAALVGVRLRFPILLIVAVGLVARWEVLSSSARRLADRALGSRPEAAAVSSDTEFFCPMDPGVLSDWPSKCPICNMTLVRRKRGDATPLPEGVVARMQLSPYRIQLAGLATSAIGYRPLMRELTVPAVVTEPADSGRPTARAVAELFDSQAEGVEADLEAEVTTGSGMHPRTKVVAMGRQPRLEIDDEGRTLQAGDQIRATIFVPAASLLPFRGQPRELPPVKPGEKRSVYRCPDHVDVVREAAGTCAADRGALVSIRLADNQRIGYWCPMHPDVTGESGASCDDCGGMRLVPRIVSYAPPGQVLAVPESAVIDTGTRRVVYVERMPGMLDGVEVSLGPRCGDFYPVADGLEPGDRVVDRGAFLVDAETRLNPSLASAYFGATRPGGSTVDQQGDCPVTGKKLGSMGAPVKVTIEGRPVLLCCEGCEPALRSDPARYLVNLSSTKNRPADAP